MDYSVPQLLVSIANTGNVKITNKNKADYVKLFDYFCKMVVLL